MEFDSVKALAYLQSQFNPSVDLCFEAPINDAFKKTFWAMNDNGLAIRALERLGDHGTRDLIAAKLQSLSAFGHDGFKNNGWADPFIHAPLAMTSFRGPQCYRYNVQGGIEGSPMVCSAGMVGVLQEEWNGKQISSWDMGFLISASKALSFHKQNNTFWRDIFISIIESKWDNSNQGFLAFSNNDVESVKGTMNLAVYILLGEKIGWGKSWSFKGRKDQALKMLNSLQLPNGGFSTGYTSNKGVTTPVDTLGNTETSCLGIYANLNPGGY